VSRIAKDPAEVIKFMTLFARLKDWLDDAPDELAEIAATDPGVQDLCTQLSFAAHFLKMNERRARALFAAPVAPANLPRRRTNACEGMPAWHVREGRFGDVRLDGFNLLALGAFEGTL
jgi:hypothetical protein